MQKVNKVPSVLPAFSVLIHLSNHSSEFSCTESISLSNTYITVTIFCSRFSKGQQREHTQESTAD